MWGRGQFQVIHVYSLLGSKAYFPPFECGLGLVTCFQRVEYGKGKTVTSQWRMLANTTLTNEARCKSAVMSCWYHVPPEML